MSGIFERVASLAGSEVAQATNLFHETFKSGMGEHGHTGRALVESVAKVCRNHPNLVGIGAGLVVEQLLLAEKLRYDAHHPESQGGATIDPALAPARPVPLHLSRVANLRPGRIAMEVFGGLMMLKLAATGARIFRHKRQGEAWFAPAAKVRLFSGTLAAYYLCKSLKSPRLSAWRNAAILLFATDALKPVLRLDPKLHRPAAATSAPVARAQPPVVQTAVLQAMPVAAQPAPETPHPPLVQPDYASPSADPMIGQGRVVHAFSVGKPTEADAYQSRTPPPANGA